MAYGSTNLPPSVAGERSLRLLHGEKSRATRRELPGAKRRRKGKLSLVTGRRLTGSGGGWRTSTVFGIGLMFAGVILGVITMAAMHFGASQSATTAASKPAVAVHVLSSRAAVQALAPAVRDVQLGLHDLNKGDVAAARTHLDRALPAAVKIQVRLHAAGAPTSNGGTLLRRGVDTYVAAVTTIRDDIHRGNLFAAGQASMAIADAESDILLSLGGVVRHGPARFTPGAKPLPFAQVSG